MNEFTKQMIAAAPTIQQATAADIPALDKLIELSVRYIVSSKYSPQQIESALEFIFGVDTHLIDEGTYYIAKIDGDLAGCGGWSRSAKLYGGNQITVNNVVKPIHPTAKIRAFFIHPQYVGQGVGRHLLQVSELAARRAGFKQLELVATLTGAMFYQKCGFSAVEPMDISLPDGVSLQAIKMKKQW